MVSGLDSSRDVDTYIDTDVHTLLLRLSHCEAKRHMRMKHAHDEVLVLLVTVIVLLALILFIMVWKWC
jgi:hypothetical protein